MIKVERNFLLDLDEVKNYLINVNLLKNVNLIEISAEFERIFKKTLFNTYFYIYFALSII